MATESKSGKTSSRGKQQKNCASPAKKKKAGNAKEETAAKMPSTSRKTSAKASEKTLAKPPKSESPKEPKSTKRPSKAACVSKKVKKAPKPEVYKNRHNIGRRTAGRVHSYKETDYTVVYPDGYWEEYIKAETHRLAAVGKSESGERDAKKDVTEGVEVKQEAQGKKRKSSAVEEEETQRKPKEEVKKRLKEEKKCPKSPAKKVVKEKAEKKKQVRKSVSKSKEQEAEVSKPEEEEPEEEEEEEEDEEEEEEPKPKKPRFADIAPRAPRIKRTACLNANAIVSLMYEKEEPAKRPKMDSPQTEEDSESSDAESADWEISFPKWKPAPRSPSRSKSTDTETSPTAANKSKSDGKEAIKTKKKDSKKKDKEKVKKKKKKGKKGSGTENGVPDFSPWSPPRRLASLNAQAILTACMDERVKKTKVESSPGSSSGTSALAKESHSKAQKSPAVSSAPPGRETESASRSKRKESVEKKPKVPSNKKAAEPPSSTSFSQPPQKIPTFAASYATTGVKTVLPSGSRPVPKSVNGVNKSPDVQIVEVKASPGSPIVIPSQQPLLTCPPPRPSAYVTPAQSSMGAPGLYQQPLPASMDYMRYGAPSHARSLGTQTSFPLPHSHRHYPALPSQHLPAVSSHYSYPNGAPSPYPPPQAHQGPGQYANRDLWSPHSNMYRHERMPFSVHAQFKDSTRMGHPTLRYPTPTPPPSQSPFDNRIPLAHQHHLAGPQSGQYVYPPASNMYQAPPVGHLPSGPQQSYHQTFPHSQPLGPPHPLEQPISPAPVPVRPTSPPKMQQQQPPQRHCLAPPMPQPPHQHHPQPKPYPDLHPRQPFTTQHQQPSTYASSLPPQVNPSHHSQQQQQRPKAAATTAKSESHSKHPPSTTAKEERKSDNQSSSSSKEDTKLLYNSGGSKFHSRPDSNAYPPQQAKPTLSSKPAESRNSTNKKPNPPPVTAPPKAIVVDSKPTPAQPPEDVKLASVVPRQQNGSQAPPESTPAKASDKKTSPQRVEQRPSCKNGQNASEPTQDACHPAATVALSVCSADPRSAPLPATGVCSYTTTAAPLPAAGVCSYTTTSAPVPSNCQPFMVSTMSVAEGAFPVFHQDYGSAFAVPTFEDQQRLTFGYYQPAGPLIQTMSADSVFLPHPMGIHHPQVKVLVHNAGFVSQGVCQEVITDGKTDAQLVAKSDQPTSVVKPMALAIPMDKSGNAAIMRSDIPRDLIKKSEGLPAVPALVPIAPAPPKKPLNTPVAIAPRPPTSVSTKVTTVLTQPQPTAAVQVVKPQNKKAPSKSPKGTKAQVTPKGEPVVSSNAVVSSGAAAQVAPLAMQCPVRLNQPVSAPVTTSTMNIQPQLAPKVSPTLISSAANTQVKTQQAAKTSSKPPQKRRPRSSEKSSAKSTGPPPNKVPKKQAAQQPKESSKVHPVLPMNRLPAPPPVITVTIDPCQPLNLSKSASSAEPKVTNNQTTTSASVVRTNVSAELSKPLPPLVVNVSSADDSNLPMRRTSPRLASPKPLSPNATISASAPVSAEGSAKNSLKTLKAKEKPSQAPKDSPPATAATTTKPTKPSAQKQGEPATHRVEPSSETPPKKAAKERDSTPSPKSRKDSSSSKPKDSQRQKTPTGTPTAAKVPRLSPTAKAKVDDNSSLPKSKKEHASGKKSPSLESTKALSPFTKRKESKKSVSSWEWHGDSKVNTSSGRSDSPSQNQKCFLAIRHKTDGDIIKKRDCVLVKSGPRKRDIPFVAKICSLWEKEGEMYMSVFWYYRPEHTETDKLPRCINCEVFASKHRDIIPVNCIEDKCYVLTFNEYCRYRAEMKRQEEKCPKRSPVVPDVDPASPDFRPSRLPPSGVDPESVFLCRKVYDVKLKRVLKNPQIHASP